MGSYVCKLAHGPGRCVHAQTSSREIILVFANGHRWKMPEMILHYIVDHNWLPPAEFVEDVMHVPLDQTGEQMTVVNPAGTDMDTKFGIQLVGYLGTKVPTGQMGDLPEQVLEQLRYYVTYSGKLVGRRFLASFG